MDQTMSFGSEFKVFKDDFLIFSQSDLSYSRDPNKTITFVYALKDYSERSGKNYSAEVS